MLDCVNKLRRFESIMGLFDSLARAEWQGFEIEGDLRLAYVELRYLQRSGIALSSIVS